MSDRAATGQLRLFVQQVLIWRIIDPFFVQKVDEAAVIPLRCSPYVAFDAVRSRYRAGALLDSDLTDLRGDRMLGDIPECLRHWRYELIK